MDIDTMKKNDYKELVALWSCFAGNTMTGADSMEDFEKFLSRNADYCFSAFENGRLVGSVMAGSDESRGYIYHLAVDESLQGKGTGRKLMDAAENALRDAEIEKAHLFIAGVFTVQLISITENKCRGSDIAVMSKVLIGDKYMGTRIEK